MSLTETDLPDPGALFEDWARSQIRHLATDVDRLTDQVAALRIRLDAAGLAVPADDDATEGTEL